MGEYPISCPKVIPAFYMKVCFHMGSENGTWQGWKFALVNQQIAG